jgi:hypothetical protein
MTHKARILGIAFIFLLWTAVSFPQQINAPLENADVVKMTANHFGDEFLIKVIAMSDNHFDVSPSALIALKKAGVSDKVIGSMQEAVNKKQAPQPAAAVPVNPPAIAASAVSTANAAPSVAGMQGVTLPAGIAMPQMPAVSLIAGGSTSPLHFSVAQIARTGTPQGMPGANAMSSMSPLSSLSGQNMSFSTLAAAANLIPMVRVATMASKLFSMHKNAEATSGATFAWGLPNRTSSVNVPTPSPAFDIQWAATQGIDPDAYEPTLVKLIQTSNNWRLVGAGNVIVGVSANNVQPKITEEKTAAKTTRLDRGHVRLEPTASLTPGEYAVVLRPLANHVPQNQTGQDAAKPSTAAADPFFYAVWDFTVPAPAAAAK